MHPIALRHSVGMYMYIYSPTSLQKSPALNPKSPALLLHESICRLCFLKALHFWGKKIPTLLQKISSPQPKRPILVQKRPALLQKESSTTGKEPCTTFREPCATAREPSISAKPYTSAKEPSVRAKEPSISAKEPYVTASRLTA